MDVNLKKLDEVKESKYYDVDTAKFTYEFLRLLESGISFEEICALLEMDYREYQVQKYALAYMKVLKTEEQYFDVYNEVCNIQSKIVSDNDASNKVHSLKLANNLLVERQKNTTLD